MRAVLPMTTYVRTRVQLGEVEAGTIGQMFVDRPTFQVMVKFNHHIVTLAAALAADALEVLRPARWKAVLHDLSGARHTTELPADPVTYDPPERWRVPVALTSPREWHACDPSPIAPAERPVVREYVRVRIPDGCDFWVYREGGSAF